MAQGNRIYVNTATAGTGTVTLGAVKSAQFCTFAEAGLTDGQTIRSYILEEGTDFEIGYGVYNSAGPTLTRATVRLSRIGGVAGTTKMTLAGTATVRVIAAKEDLVLQDESGNVAITGTLDSAGNFSVATNKLTVAAASGNTAIAGTLAVTGALTLSAVGLIYDAKTLTGSTGTGNMVLSASPTFTGTITAAAATLSGVLAVNGASITLTNSSAQILSNGNATFNPLSNDSAAFVANGSFGGGFVLKDGTGRAGFWTSASGGNLNISAGGTSSGFSGTTAGAIVISANGTASTTTGNGALVVNGGVGISGDLNWVGAGASQTTPTPTSSGGSFTATSTVRTKYFGKFALVTIQVVVSSIAGVPTGAIQVTVPTAALIGNAGWAVDNSNGGIAMVAQILASGTTAQILPISGGIQAHTYFATFFYETA